MEHLQFPRASLMAIQVAILVSSSAAQHTEVAQEQGDLTEYQRDLVVVVLFMGLVELAEAQLVLAAPSPQVNTALWELLWPAEKVARAAIHPPQVQLGGMADLQPHLAQAVWVVQLF